MKNYELNTELNNTTLDFTLDEINFDLDENIDILDCCYDIPTFDDEWNNFYFDLEFVEFN